MLSPRILLIIALVRISNTVTSGSEEIDICNLRNSPMYCNCEPVSRNESAITCFIINRIDSDDDLWSAFEQVNDVVVALTLTSRDPVKLEYLPVTSFRHLPYLQTITVQEGKLGSVESRSVSNMTHLTRLLLERNEITSLQQYSVSHLPKLKKLILSENYLREILADSLFDLMELEELYLDRNNISRIETCAFCSLHNLKELELWGNMITDLTEPMFRGLRYLKRIDLYRNRLKIISSKVFLALPSLEEIDLKENILEYISDQAFDGLSNLMRLELNDNRLKSLSGTLFKYPKKLISVDVSSNLLETLEEDVVANLANVEDSFFSFRFGKNPLRCGCDLQWVSRYMRTANSPAFVRELRQTQCQNAEGTWEFAYLLRMDCEEKPSPTAVVATSDFTSTIEPNSSTAKFPRKAPAKNIDDDNVSCRLTSNFELCFLLAILSLLICCREDI